MRDLHAYLQLTCGKFAFNAQGINNRVITFHSNSKQSVWGACATNPSENPFCQESTQNGPSHPLWVGESIAQKSQWSKKSSENHVRYGQVQNQIIYRNPVKETQSTIVDNSFKSEDFKCLRSHLLNQLIYNHSICLYSSLISYPRMRLQCKKILRSTT